MRIPEGSLARGGGSHWDPIGIILQCHRRQQGDRVHFDCIVPSLMLGAKSKTATFITAVVESGLPARRTFRGLHITHSPHARPNDNASSRVKGFETLQRDIHCPEQRTFSMFITLVMISCRPSSQHHHLLNAAIINLTEWVTYPVISKHRNNPKKKKKTP